MSSTAVIWLTRKYICKNGIVEKTKFPARIPAGTTKRERKKEIARVSRAADNAERELARWLNNNFSADEDVHLLLTYSERGYERLQARAAQLMAAGVRSEADALFMAAQKELENFVRRVRYDVGAVELRYIGSTSDMDGDTGKPVRLHHHVIINRAALKACMAKWARMGFVMEEELYHVNGDFTALAQYLIRQVRYIPNAKRYTLSRNLTPPAVSAPVEIVRYAESEMRVPRGCTLLYRAPYTRGASQYVRYFDPGSKTDSSHTYPLGAGDTTPRRGRQTRSERPQTAT